MGGNYQFGLGINIWGSFSKFWEDANPFFITSCEQMVSTTS